MFLGCGDLLRHECWLVVIVLMFLYLRPPVCFGIFLFLSGVFHTMRSPRTTFGGAYPGSQRRTFTNVRTNCE
jgi:hypothetical protein